MAKKNCDNDNIYAIVLDTGGLRQVITEDHSPDGFEQWEGSVLSAFEERGYYQATIASPGVGGTTYRHVLLTRPQGGTVACMTADDIERAQQRAQLAQGGQLIHQGR